MERQPIDSSVMATVGYDEAGHVLEVEFHSGRIYHYFLVPPEMHEALMSAESPGEYFNLEIKPRFRFEEVGPEDAPVTPR